MPASVIGTIFSENAEVPSPPLLAPDKDVTCHKCGHVCTVEAAVSAGLKSGVVKKLSDHRVVQGN